MTKQQKADIALLIVTLIWGSSFVLTKNALEYLPTYSFLAVRFLMAAILSGMIFFKNMRAVDKNTLKYGTLIGIILFLGYAFQTVGINYTTASKSGFITGFSVVIVPIVSAGLLKQKPHKEAVIGVFFAILGLGFLTLNSSLTLNIGDFYTLIGAFMFAMHIITVGKYTHRVDSIAMAVIQIAVVGVLSGFSSLIIRETYVIPTGVEVWVSIFILAALATSGAFIVQNTMQKFTSPTHTALIYSGEPVFAALFAYLMLGETLPPQGILGSILILSGMLISELDWKTLFNTSKKKLQSN